MLSVALPAEDSGWLFTRIVRDEIDITRKQGPLQQFDRQVSAVQTRGAVALKMATCDSFQGWWTTRTINLTKLKDNLKKAVAMAVKACFRLTRALQGSKGRSFGRRERV